MDQGYKVKRTDVIMNWKSKNFNSIMEAAKTLKEEGHILGISTLRMRIAECCRINAYTGGKDATYCGYYWEFATGEDM